MNASPIIDDLSRRRMLDLLEGGKRADGRAFDEVRKITVETGVIPKAQGSARVRLGGSEVVCGVKIQPDKPFPDTGDRGVFICTAELLPLSHPSVETGPPGPDVIELARVVDRGIRESHMVDVSQLVIERDVSVVGVFADNTVVDYDGNLFDACSYATAAALLTAKSPKWEMVDGRPSLVEGAVSDLPTATLPVSVTMAKIGGHIVVDPDADEWECMDARVTITTDSNGNICAMQKGGKQGFTVEEIKACGKMSVDVGGRVRDVLKTQAGAAAAAG